MWPLKIDDFLYELLEIRTLGYELLKIKSPTHELSKLGFISWIMVE